MNSETNNAKAEYSGDTVDRVPLHGFPTIKRRLEERGAVQYEKKLKPDNLKLLTGDFKDSEDDDRHNQVIDLTQKEMDYLKEAKREPLNVVSAGKYFLNRKLVFNFGITTALKCRLGFCEQTGVWRILIMRPNTGCKPSVLSLAYAEVEELVELLNNILEKIENGIKKGEPYLKPPTEQLGPEWRAKRSDTIQFWQKDVFFTSSGRVRIRVQWMFGDCYSIYLNNPNDNSMYEKYFGPKIRLGCREVSQLIEILNEIVFRCPPYQKMADFLEYSEN